MALTFTVYGVASGMGSKRAFTPKGWTRPIITDTNRGLKSWQNLIAEGASHALQQLPECERAVLGGGVRLIVAFYLPPPKALAKTALRAHLRAPDLDKLVRAVADAMSRVVWGDDGQIVELIASKAYAVRSAPHVDITVEETAGVVALPAPVALSLLPEERTE